jgi:DNA-binding Lrp family transcriptional regulator
MEENKLLYFDSRHEALAELQKVGLNTTICDGLSLESLNELMQGVKRILRSRQSERTIQGSAPRRTTLTNIDKKIISRLISSSGRVSAPSLSKELDIPLTTLQRHKRKLEDKLIETNYSVKLEELGWKKVTLLVSISKADPVKVGKEILELSRSVISVRRIMGSMSMDLAAEMIFKTNEDLVSMMEKIRLISGVGQIAWMEIVGTPIGINEKYYEEVLG